jgi:hypothetical protein
LDGETQGSSPPLRRILTSLAFLFDNEQALVKVIRLRIEALPIWRPQIDSKGKCLLSSGWENTSAASQPITGSPDSPSHACLLSMTPQS